MGLQRDAWNFWRNWYYLQKDGGRTTWEKEQKETTSHHDTGVPRHSIVLWNRMPGLYQRLDSANDSRHRKRHFDVSYGSKEPILTKKRPSKWGFEIRRRNIQLRRTVSRWILVRWRQVFHENVAHDVEYRACNRDVSGDDIGLGEFWHAKSDMSAHKNQ